MKTMTTAELKAQFSQVVAELKQGHQVVITYGRKKEPLATIVPQSQMNQPNYAIQLGDLKKSGWSYKLNNFEMSPEELLGE